MEEISVERRAMERKSGRNCWSVINSSFKRVESHKRRLMWNITGNLLLDVFVSFWRLRRLLWNVAFHLPPFTLYYTACVCLNVILIGLFAAFNCTWAYFLFRTPCQVACSCDVTSSATDPSLRFSAFRETLRSSCTVHVETIGVEWRYMDGFCLWGENNKHNWAGKV
jgi:hypothetical protein